MSLLAPLYIAGALAIALPIIFHLIRRTPQKRQTFSSLMFLTPSPPRLTRRSRLTNILLLILRGLALALLAIAFARPFFFRSEDLKIDATKGRRVALLVDTSASMKRGDLWNQAKQQVEQALKDALPTDEVALFYFDRTLRPAFTFTQWNELEQSRRAPMLQAELAKASPTWASTNLGEALSAVADQLAETQGSAQSPDTAARQIILISDLQQGAHVEALQGHEWPDNVLLDVKAVALKQSTNANMQLVKEESDAPESHDERLRVRVTNQPRATSEQFTITWANQRGALAAVEPQKIYVPPGRSQVARIHLPPPAQQADQQPDRLILAGDDFGFDNTLYVVAPRPDVVRIVYLGDDAPDDAKGLTYYLGSAVTETSLRKTEFLQRRTTETLLEPDLLGARLVVVAGAPDDRVAILRRYLEAGGDVLWVLKDAAASQGLSRLMQIDSLEVKDAASRDFALISRVNLDHPLFVPFADSRFADFSKIHFWQHRTIKLPDPSPAQALASFDNGDPFLLEAPIGQGRLRIMTAGWQPDDSQLALSTKFVPLIGGMLQRRDPGIAETQYVLGDALPQGIAADAPGIYRATVKNEQIPLAVNLGADESRTAPIAATDLEQWGAKLGNKPPTEIAVAKQRELKLFELENRQKLWRWLIVVVLGLIAAETVLAGLLARRSLQAAPSA